MTNEQNIVAGAAEAILKPYLIIFYVENDLRTFLHGIALHFLIVLLLH